MSNPSISSITGSRRAATAVASSCSVGIWVSSMTSRAISAWTLTHVCTFSPCLAWLWLPRSLFRRSFDGPAQQRGNVTDGDALAINSRQIAIVADGAHSLNVCIPPSGYSVKGNSQRLTGRMFSARHRRIHTRCVFGLFCGSRTTGLNVKRGSRRFSEALYFKRKALLKASRRPARLRHNRP